MMVNYNSITLPLHSGHPPNYLIRRMLKLSNAISKVLIDEYGTLEFLRRISDPLWFQAFGCVLGFDWHSSGLTTVLIGVLKQSLSTENHGIAIAGGKGSKARNTLNEIKVKSCNEFNLSDNCIENLSYSSKMSAKVDNSAIQDNYILYHHSILFDCDGNWSIVQQGLNDYNSTARRYHWFSENVKRGKFLIEPHSGIIGDMIYHQDRILNMTSNNSIESQKLAIDLINDSSNQESIKTSVFKLFSKRKENSLEHWFENYNQDSFHSKISMDNLPKYCNNNFSGFHYLMPKKIDWSILKKAYDIQPSNYEEFISINGVGPSTIRALSLIGELIFGTKTSWQDPAKYCFAHGGKDGIPYPINRKIYDKSIEFLNNSIDGAEISTEEKKLALKNLSKYNLKVMHTFD